jgi:molecular chaperone DnaJ
VQLKDYYAILALPPSATTEEIKKAYRRLAHLYHPDKTSDDDYAAMKFADIKEAYEVLTHPARKEDYLQQRWYLKSIGKKLRPETQTPVSILKDILALERYISKIDTHRMHAESLVGQVDSILSEKNVEMLNALPEKHVNTEIALRVVHIAEVLPYQQADILLRQINGIRAVDKTVISKKEELLHRKRKSARWDKQKPWVMLVIVLLICIMIYFFSI